MAENNDRGYNAWECKCNDDWKIFDKRFGECRKNAEMGCDGGELNTYDEEKNLCWGLKTWVAPCVACPEDEWMSGCDIRARFRTYGENDEVYEEDFCLKCKEDHHIEPY